MFVFISHTFSVERMLYFKDLYARSYIENILKIIIVYNIYDINQDQTR